MEWKKEGEELQVGVYVWVLSYTFIYNEHEVARVKTGDVTIVY